MRLSVAVVISLLGWWLWVGVDAGLISSFLPLMEEKKQKKIKASGTPANLAGYMMRVIVYQVIFAGGRSRLSSLDGRKEGPCRGREVWPGTS